MELFPLSVILHQTNKGYQLSSGLKVSHLLYLDNLKKYARSSQDIESLFETVRLFSSDIGMTFGVEKCASLSIKRGKVVECDGLKLPSGEVVRNLPFSVA